MQMRLNHDMRKGFLPGTETIDVDLMANGITDLLGNAIPHNETFKRVFNFWCGLYRERFEYEMKSTTASALMADHTFKVAMIFITRFFIYVEA